MSSTIHMGPSRSGERRADCTGTSQMTVPRRNVLTGSAALLLGGKVALTGRPAQAQSGWTPDSALEELMAGNTRFTGGRLTSFDEDLTILRQHTVAKQEPFAAVRRKSTTSALGSNCRQPCPAPGAVIETVKALVHSGSNTTCA